jgi:hypothetical protein
MARLNPMSPHHNRRRVVVGLIATFLLCIAPIHVGFSMAAPAAMQSDCPDCPKPCPGRASCEAMVTACVASISPVPRATQVPDSFPLPAAAPVYLGQQDTKTIPVPVGRSPAYSPLTALSIRFCTFQE